MCFICVRLILSVILPQSASHSSKWVELKGQHVSMETKNKLHMYFMLWQRFQRCIQTTIETYELQTEVIFYCNYLVCFKVYSDISNVIKANLESGCLLFLSLLLLLWSEPNKQVKCEYFVFLGLAWRCTPPSYFLFWIASLFIIWNAPVLKSSLSRKRTDFMSLSYSCQEMFHICWNDPGRVPSVRNLAGRSPQLKRETKNDQIEI